MENIKEKRFFKILFSKQFPKDKQLKFSLIFFSRVQQPKTRALPLQNGNSVTFLVPRQVVEIYVAVHDATYEETTKNDLSSLKDNQFFIRNKYMHAFSCTFKHTQEIKYKKFTVEKVFFLELNFLKSYAPKIKTINNCSKM